MVLSIRLPKDMYRRLEELSAATMRSKNYYVKEALAIYLDSMDDIAALKAYRKNSKQKSNSQDKLQEIMGLHPLNHKRKKY